MTTRHDSKQACELPCHGAACVSVFETALLTIQKALRKQPQGYVQTTATHWLLLPLLLLLALRQASSSAGGALQHARTLLPLMVLLLTCSDLAEEDHSAPPEPPSTVLLVNVQLLK